MTTTTPDRRPVLADPVYTIEHVAGLLHLSVDRVRHYTKGDFPVAQPQVRTTKAYRPRTSRGGR